MRPSPAARAESDWLRRLLAGRVSDSVWHNLRWDIVAGLSAGIYQGCVWSFALQLARGAQHATGLQMGLATAAPAVGYLFAIIWARQMEGKSKLPFVTLTWAISRGLFLLTPLLVRGAYHRELYVSIVCAAPIIFSVSTPAYTAIMKEIYPDAVRGRMMSVVRFGLAAAMLVTTRVMGALQENAGLDFRWMFAIGGVFGILTAVAFGRLRLPIILHSASMPPMRRFLRETFGVLKHNVGYRWFTASVFIAGSGNLIAMTLYPIYQVDHFHISPTEIASLVTALNVVTLIGLLFWGWFMDRYGSLPTVLLASSLICLMPLLYAFAPSLVWLEVASAIGGLSGAGIDIGYLNATLQFSENGRASQYQAVHSTFFGIRGTIAPFLAVSLHSRLGSNWRTGFLICLAVMLVGALCQFGALLGYRRVKASTVLR